MTVQLDLAAPPAPTVDPSRWPDVARVPEGRLRAAVAERLLHRASTRLGIRVERPDRPADRTARPGAPVLTLHRPTDFFRRVGAGGLIGFGEAYQAGDWDSPDPVALLTALAAAPEQLIPAGTSWLRRLAVRRTPRSERPTTGNARRNIHRHYDLSNELFALFLDPTLSYSSAVFPARTDGSPAASWDGLAAAQHRKIDRLLDLAAVGAGTRVLEIGTGWGELALRAAARGARVVSLTLSEEQLTLARRRIADAGFADRVDVRLCDYRSAQGSYDAVLSVEMIEAVGRPFWPAYFATLGRVLAPGGRVALQAITMPHARMLASSGTHTWILKYIFPGGQIPSLRAVEESAERHGGLRAVDTAAYGPHYAETLRLWRERFLGHAEEVAALGFDEVFRRMWELYLAHSEAGFRSGYLDVHQILLTRGQADR
ncbi:cyclopropane-fatty-acyl-phospholipid synthase [Kitasatospora griseola]|uniref:Cyclopropane-fatty-acyl-phospholipid synthase n=1 Tax=Kitasatospora griseola TaxID=2064 RepID=A0A0D0PV51_KITGR|nr:class I SAM-dependent methyltransferase [Kitasatospora griseola]KIQ66409.1 cyclopropane-fatty-acyl-phospholipid synthase [Kitasatospora griseola]